MLFSEIIGQEEVKQRLLQTVKDSRIPHAQLFLAAEGSGALALSLAYAQYISCPGRSESDSCGKCPSCVKYNKLAHPDLHFVFPIIHSKDLKVSTHLLPEWREAVTDNPYMSLFQWYEFLEAENKQGNIGVEESAEILRKLSLTTYEAEYKIMIIWIAEKMNIAAANKLLKILEEPPDKTLFLMICENEDQLLRTIVSRTQLVKIRKIEDNALKQALVDRKGLSPADAMRIVHLADGNYNAALQLLSENENAAFNLAAFQELMRAAYRFDTQKVMAWVGNMATIGRERQKNFLLYALHVLRESLLLNYSGPQLVKLEGEELAFIKKFAPFVNGANCEAMINELNRASIEIERNAHPKILFTDLALKFNELLNIKQTAAQ